MAKPPLIKVTQVEMIHPLCVEVKVTGPGRTTREYVIDFTRKGKVRGAFEYKEEEYYKPEEIPSVVNSAAKAVYNASKS